MPENIIDPLVELGVISINLSELKVNIDVLNKDKSNITVLITQNTSFALANEIMKLSFTLSYKYEDAPDLLIDITCDTIFHVKGINAYQKVMLPSKLPVNVLVNCVSIGLGHCRVYLSQAIANTPLARHINLPIFDVLKVTSELYPIEFEKGNKVTT